MTDRRPSWAAPPDSPIGADQEEARRRAGVTWMELVLSEDLLQKERGLVQQRTESAERAERVHELADEVEAFFAKATAYQTARVGKMNEARLQEGPGAVLREYLRPKVEQMHAAGQRVSEIVRVLNLPIHRSELLAFWYRQYGDDQTFPAPAKITRKRIRTILGK